MRAVLPFNLDLDASEVVELQEAFGDILRSGSLTLGRFTEEFEVAFSRAHGCRYGVATSSGTSALEVLLRIRGAAGREVAVPTNTNFATVAAILSAGGRPRFLDMNRSTFMPSLEQLRRLADRCELAGVVAVHIGSLIAPDFQEVASFCRDRGLFLIEDAAHAHGSRLAGRAAGTFGDGGAFSFFPTKVMTTMEGGMITTDDESTALSARSFRNQGKRLHKFGGLHQDLGSSWRMLEISAAMGLVQLRKLDAMLAHRARIASAYTRAVERMGHPGVSVCSTAHMERASHYKVIISCATDIPGSVLKDRFRQAGVVLGGAVYNLPCHLQPVFTPPAVEPPTGPLPIAECWCPRHICLPITSGTTEAEVEKVVQAVNQILPAACDGAALEAFA